MNRIGPAKYLFGRVGRSQFYSTTRWGGVDIGTSLTRAAPSIEHRLFQPSHLLLLLHTSHCGILPLRYLHTTFSFETVEAVHRVE